jgi:hypothetical protein
MRSNTAMPLKGLGKGKHSTWKGAGQRSNPGEEREWSQTSSLNGMHPSGLVSERGATQHLCWSEAVSWAWEDLNLRPHPYQRSTAKRHANQRSPRSGGSGRVPRSGGNEGVVVNLSDGA